MSQSGLERSHQRYGPFTVVLVMSEEHRETEHLYVSQILGTSMQRTWPDETGEEQHTRYMVTERINTPQPMVLEDVLKWVESAPDELNDALETDLGTSIGFSE